MAKVGIDFGTTNSSVVFFDRDNSRPVSLLRQGDGSSDLSTSYAPSELMINRQNEVICGWNISNNYRHKANSLMIYNLKSKLLDDYDNTLIHGFQKWDLLKYFMQYLINNANHSPYLTFDNDRIEEVVLSVPHNASTIYTTKMKETVEAGKYFDSCGNGYSVIVSTLQEEPVAISLNLFESDSNYKGSNVLVYDMGGGTTDFAVVRNRYDVQEVLGHNGVNKAGNYIDDLIIKALLRKCNISEDDFFSDTNHALNRSRYNIRKDVKECIEKNGEVPVELWLNDQCIYDDNLTEGEYHEIIASFIQETIELSRELVNTHAVTDIILAGGSSNCRLIKSMFRQIFPDIRVNSDVADKRIATAAGNAAWYQLPSPLSVKNILNYSYGLSVRELRSRTEYIDIFFHRNEELPIIDRYINYYTLNETKRVSYNFFVGHEEDINVHREYDFNKCTEIAGNPFFYNFGHVVPQGTQLRTYFSMDQNGVMTIRVESDLADMKSQIFTITGLE